MEVYVDTDFVGNYDCQDRQIRDTARSRNGYIAMHKGLPVSYTYQLQAKICLFSTESEYIGLSHALREVIPLILLLQEMKQHSLIIH